MTEHKSPVLLAVLLTVSHAFGTEELAYQNVKVSRECSQDLSLVSTERGNKTSWSRKSKPENFISHNNAFIVTQTL